MIVETGAMDERKHDLQYTSVLHLQTRDGFYDHMMHYKRNPVNPAI